MAKHLVVGSRSYRGFRNDDDDDDDISVDSDGGGLTRHVMKNGMCYQRIVVMLVCW